jgi:hypothetical protein
MVVSRPMPLHHSSCSCQALGLARMRWSSGARHSVNGLGNRYDLRRVTQAPIAPLRARIGGRAETRSARQSGAALAGPRPFGVVITSSVRVAGVLLVFSYLIVPALAGTVLGGRLSTRSAIGWAFGTAVSILGVAGSAILDTPTGATVVCAFGLSLLILTGFRPVVKLPAPRPGEPAAQQSRCA